MKLFFSFILILFTIYSGAQDTSKFQLGLGYGLYEGININGKLKVKENSLLGLSIGHNFSFINNENYFSLTTEYNYLLNKLGNPTSSPWFISPKLHFTRLNNEYYL